MSDRQKWEYLSLCPNSWADISACGEQGWELVVVLLGDANDTGSCVYFFKRPKL